MRITTNAMVRNYNGSLTESLYNVNLARTRVSTKRKYQKASEDPASAERAAQLQRRYLRTADYIDTVETTQSRQDAADSALQQITKLLNEALNSDALRASSDTQAAQRQTFATTLRGIQNSLIETANTTFEGKYLFAGADGSNLPFSITNDGKITYRGIDVSSTNPADQAILDELKDEKLYVDIGLGIKTTTGAPATSSSDINEASALDISITGVKAFGYGTIPGSADSDGNPISKNIFALLGQMANELEKDPLDQDIFNQMKSQLKTSFDGVVDFNAGMGVKSKFLETTKDRLEDDQITIYEQMDKIENIEPAEAIMDFSYSQYAYNMLLKVGTSLLSNSFIDFMK